MLNYALAFSMFFLSITAHAVDVPILHFSLAPYSQRIADYVSPSSPDHSNSLLKKDYQFKELKQFYTHYYASNAEGLSPWSNRMVKAILLRAGRIEKQLIEEFNNQVQDSTHQHYGENYKLHDVMWFNQLKQSMNLPAIFSAKYKASARAIVVNHTLVRVLPDSAPDFFDFTQPGQGFPFDNLQLSTLWSGTPLYAISTTKDGAWTLIFSPDAAIGWVKSTDIAYVSNAFIAQWQSAAKKHLMAVTKTATPVVDNQGRFQFLGYMGAVYPRGKGNQSILIPQKLASGQAVIRTAIVQRDAIHEMPLAGSPKNISGLLTQLHRRPYGWGGAYFFNDCSSEMKNLLAPLGIWLPRSSLAQSKFSRVDLSNRTPSERIAALKQAGHPLMTLIYVDGHIMLYIGITPDNTVMTYQNTWGLSSLTGDKRYVIGQAVFLPLLAAYPQDARIHSQADKPHFQLIFLDDLIISPLSPEQVATTYFDEV